MLVLLYLLLRLTIDCSQLLKTRHEINANAVWRFLQLRGYVDRKHQLTGWGKALRAALSAFGTRKEQEEAAFIAIELLRHNILNANTMFPDSSGAPLRGSGKVPYVIIAMLKLTFYRSGQA